MNNAKEKTDATRLLFAYDAAASTGTVAPNDKTLEALSLVTNVALPEAAWPLPDAGTPGAAMIVSIGRDYRLLFPN